MTKSDILLGYIKASSYRSKIIRVLEEKKLTPSEMAEKTEVRLSHVSNTLAELLEKDLVICLNPDSKKGRIYELTKEGHNILLYLRQ